MKERGILFTPENITAILENRKTQTRRIVHVRSIANQWLEDAQFTPAFVSHPENNLCPYGHPGDRLYVKEGLSKGPAGNVCWRRDGLAVYPIKDWQWQRDTLSPLHMPKDCARLWLELTEVRVERLQQITYDDEGAEGVMLGPECNDRHSGFMALWDSVNGQGAWMRNDWVWVLSFTVTKEA